MKATVKWRGDNPNPKKVLEELHNHKLAVIREGVMLNPTLEEGRSELTCKTMDPKDLFRFLFEVSLLICEKPENAFWDSESELDFGKIGAEIEGLKERIRQLEKVLASTSTRIKEATIFPRAKIRAITEDLDRHLKAHLMTY